MQASVQSALSVKARHQDASAAVAATNAATEKATLGDLDALAALKEKLS